MRCMCCNKELQSNEYLWHKKCIKSFFGTNVLPKINISFDDDYLIKENNSFISGVQKKLSIHIDINAKGKITYFDSNSNYIIKPQTEYKDITILEHLSMLMAEKYGLKTAKHALIKINNEYCYITKRFDRDEDNKIHVEDFCQLANKLSIDKYNGSYELVYRILKKYSNSYRLDKITMYKQILFSFIIGNDDLHLKNFSLIEKDNTNLSLIYDLLPSKLYVNNNDDDLALSLNGKKINITKKDLISFGLYAEIELKLIERFINELLNLENEFINIINESVASTEMKDKFINLIKNNFERIK